MFLLYKVCTSTPSLYSQLYPSTQPQPPLPLYPPPPIPMLTFEGDVRGPFHIVMGCWCPARPNSDSSFSGRAQSKACFFPGGEGPQSAPCHLLCAAPGAPDPNKVTCRGCHTPRPRPFFSHRTPFPRPPGQIHVKPRESGSTFDTPDFCMIQKLT